MKLKPAWEVCREVGFWAQSLLFESGLVGVFFPPHLGGVGNLGGFLGCVGVFSPKSRVFFIPVWVWCVMALSPMGIVPKPPCGFFLLLLV